MSINHFQVVVQSNLMVLATTDCFVIRWNVDSASDPEGKKPTRGSASPGRQAP